MAFKQQRGQMDATFHGGLPSNRVGRLKAGPAGRPETIGAGDRAVSCAR